MCCKNRTRRTGGCCSRRYNANYNPSLPLGNTQAPVVLYERRPGLVGMLVQHIVQKRQAKQQFRQQQNQQPQQIMGYKDQPKEVAFIDEKKVEEDRKMVEEKQAQAMWDEKRGASEGGNGAAGVGVDHVQRQSLGGGNGYQRYSAVSVGTELPSYGQAMRQ